MKGNRLFSLVVAAAAAVLLLAFRPALAQEKAALTTLEWPPYTGDALADKGASAKIARAAFAAAGVNLSVQVFPWNRAVQLAKTSPDFIGYFPEYHSAEIAADFIFSERMGDSPLVFIENPAKPVVWNALADLKGVTIGTVSGYVNTEEFDKMAAAGQLAVDPASDDETNIRKVAVGRLALAVIDANVFRYLVANKPDLGKLKDKVQVNAKILENKGLFICFRKNAQGEKLAKAFKEGLAKIDYKKMQDEYFATVLK
ncbi:MAG: transporter substrate-binding domain-containing protein [Thermodesulfobacteriota bacterium]